VTEDEEVPGLAGERTELAWSRTSLSMAAVAAVVLRRVWEQLDTVTARAAVLGLLAAAGTAWAAALWWATFVGRTSLEGRPVVDAPVLRRVAAATFGLGVLALVLALVPYP
jgi:uncharacterized membrane protein YidH (DUF202 family)